MIADYDDLGFWGACEHRVRELRTSRIMRDDTSRLRLLFLETSQRLRSRGMRDELGRQAVAASRWICTRLERDQWSDVCAREPGHVAESVLQNLPRPGTAVREGSAGRPGKLCDGRYHIPRRRFGSCIQLQPASDKPVVGTGRAVV